MRTLSDLPLRERLRARLAERGASLVLALAVETLLILIIIFAIVPALTPRKPDARTIGFDVSGGESAPDSTPAETKRVAQKGSAANPAVRPPVPQPEVVPPTPEAPAPHADILWLSPQDYASRAVSPGKAADAPAVASADSGASSGGRTDSPMPGRKGPHGESIYLGNMYRAPSYADLAFYLPGWARGKSIRGRVLCKFASNDRVEDCQELDDTPRGSRFAGAMRQNAHQFRIKPPLRNGKPIPGALVEITLVFTVEDATEKDDGARPAVDN